MDKCDLAVIGAGVVGLSIAYELSKYKLDVICIEKESEVATGASGNNSGVIHSGMNLKPGSMKAKLCVEGNRMMYGLCQELNVPCKKIGTLVVALNAEETIVLNELKRRAELNNVQGVRLLTKDEARFIEPHIEAEAGLISPMGGITLPKVLCQKLAENAKKNGATFFFNTRVSSITGEKGFRLKGDGVEVSADIVLNCAGLYSDEIAMMVGLYKFEIKPWLGEYYVVIGAKAELIRSMVYPAPQFGAAGLGIHLTKSLEDHLLVGPNAKPMKDKHDKFRSPPEEFHDAIAKFLPGISVDDLQYGYSGIRAKLAAAQSVLDADFVIEEYPTNFIHLMGIESPGLTASPAIAKYVMEILSRRIDLKPR
jgi:glycerol-3-phosphate dehydrogenase